MKHYLKLCAAVVMAMMLTACNMVYISPGRHIEPGTKIYASRGGYGMERVVKVELESRGYDVMIGKLVSHGRDEDGGVHMAWDRNLVPVDAQYVIRVKEREDKIRPIFCALNGFHWWSFNLSISEQSTGHEILTWRGRGCANSSVRRFQRLMDEIEEKDHDKRDITIDNADSAGM